MGFKCGIVGLPNVGKSTLFNALTETAAAQAANYPFCTIEPNVGEVAVPDPRLDVLAKLAKSAEIVPTRLTFVDIAGQPEAQLAALEKFFSDPGVAGISKNWRGREELYAEREDELLRRYEHSRLRGRSRRKGEAVIGLGFAEEADQRSNSRPKRSKPK